MLGNVSGETITDPLPADLMPLLRFFTREISNLTPARQSASAIGSLELGDHAHGNGDPSAKVPFYGRNKQRIGLKPENALQHVSDIVALMCYDDLFNATLAGVERFVAPTYVWSSLPTLTGLGTGPVGEQQLHGNVEVTGH